MAEHYPVVVSAGSLRAPDGVPMPHAWTPGGVSVECILSGAHVQHLAVAGCVLNDVYRQGTTVKRLGIDNADGGAVHG